MAEKVSFELVSPEQLLIAADVDMVVAPGSEGDFGVMYGHMPFISTLRDGLVEIHDDGSVTERLLVVGGFADVSATRCTVLTEEAHILSQLNRDDVARQLARARDEVEGATTDEEQEDAEVHVAKLQMMLAALDRHATP